MLAEQARDALQDERVVRRFRAKLWLVSGTDCVWWTGAVSGRGHGRFWVGRSSPGQSTVMIAHRFAYALAYGPDALDQAAVLGHWFCDNPLCQNVEHIAPTTPAGNAHDWAVHRHRRAGPLNDLRGSLERALAVRAVLLSGGDLAEVLAAGDPHQDQLDLF